MAHQASNFTANPWLCLLTPVLTVRRQNIMERLLPDLSLPDSPFVAVDATTLNKLDGLLLSMKQTYIKFS